jgi:DNA-binding MarR family transcriptional regulator
VNARDEKEERLTLELLNAIDAHSDLSQRHLARSMGVALGLANSYLKRCVRKGYIKIREAPANRFIYYLTPKGFSEKSRLTAHYLSTSLHFYRQAAESCSAAFADCVRSDRKRVLLCGISDLAEIAILRAMESNVDIIGLLDPQGSVHRYLSKPVWQDLKDVEPFDVVMLTDLSAPMARYRELLGLLGKDKVIVPEVLGLNSSRSG